MERATLKQRPNPSLERTATGKPLGPPAGLGHHPSSGPSAFPASAPSAQTLGITQMPEYRRLDVRDCQGTLWAFYDQYMGQGVASFEGDLGGLKLDELRGASAQETGALRRQTTEPQMDFIVVPINEETIRELRIRLSSPDVLGLDGAVIHTQLAVGEELMLIACDNFHNECTVASTAVPEQLIRQLQSSGLLRSYSDA